MDSIDKFVFFLIIVVFLKVWVVRDCLFCLLLNSFDCLRSIWNDWGDMND